MGRGFLSGIIAGLLVSFGFLLVLSTMVPMKPTPQPEKPATAPAETATQDAVSEEAAPVASSETVTPEQEAPTTTEESSAPTAPVAAPVTPMPEAPEPRQQTNVVSDVEVPGKSGFDDQPTASDAPEAVAARTDSDDSAPSANTQSAAMPEVSDNISVSPETPEATSPASPELTLESDPVLPSPAVPAPVEPETELAPTTPQGIVRKAAPGKTISSPNVAVDRLPSIGSATEPEPEEPAQVEGKALDVNAEPAEIIVGKPMVSLVLRDIGGGGVDISAWKDVNFPVTFAIDPVRPDAVEVARAYREAGFEVVLLASGLPEGATPKDLEIAMGEYLTRVPVAVALMTDITAPKPFPQSLVKQLIAIADDSGHGVVTGGKGLGATSQVRAGSDVPVVEVSRVLDAGGEDAATQRRLLDRAGFDATQSGSAVLFAHTYPWTFVTLLEWGLTGGSDQAQMVPLSAVLKASR